MAAMMSDVSEGYKSCDRTFDSDTSVDKGSMIEWNDVLTKKNTFLKHIYWCGLTNQIQQLLGIR